VRFKWNRSKEAVEYILQSVYKDGVRRMCARRTQKLWKLCAKTMKGEINSQRHGWVWKCMKAEACVETVVCVGVELWHEAHRYVEMMIGEYSARCADAHRCV
jgi:hypothetical protein